ncbi:amidase signature domain-containing protein [Exophiala viscosa]|uniref:Amidase signature domain-containing protein n=1 Tax=Exophiala viscosa TaxID=2486360 RepID=A0AAN6E527_9EURO|nr:amidase signature domain-containing protein [Exophiala viscosa]KAI1627278.1 amidase signature domain-containing protein [Exophiala viscosa]
MSTVALPNTDFQSQISVEDLRSLAAKFDILLECGADEDAYLTLLQSAEAIYEHFENVDDYIHPALVPVPTQSERKYWRPQREDNVLNAWSHRCELKATNPKTALLAGRSVAFKDNISVGGLPTTLGTRSSLLSMQGTDYPISTIDASIVSRVLDAGALVKGITTCETYSASTLSSTSFRGPVQNPWAHGYSAGGSSSGSGALVGANLVSKVKGVSFGDSVDMAIGGDQGGSIRLPAAYNGCYGMKATHGLIPYTGVMALSPMVDSVGPIANNLEDIALLLQVLAGYDGIDARMTAESPLRDRVPEYPALLRDSFAECQSSTSNTRPSFRVGLLKEAFQVPGMDPAIASHVQDSARQAFEAMGVPVVEISVPLHAEGPLFWTAATRATMSDWGIAMQTPGYLSYHPPHMKLQWPPNQDMYELLSDTNPTINNLIFSSAFLKDKYGPGVEAKAHRKVFQLRQAYDDALSQVDVLIMPTTLGLASQHPELTRDGKRTGIMERINPAIGLSSNTCPFNVTGHPALTVPCGFGKDAKTDQMLPVGMQIVGKRWDETMVLKAAAFFHAGQQDIEKDSSQSGQSHR